MQPPYRICGDCYREGREERIGTKDAPLIQIMIGVLENGLSYDARLPRWAWQLWTRFRPEQESADDKQRGELEAVPLKHEFCVACAGKLLAAPGAQDVLTQRQYGDEMRAEHARKVAADAAAAVELAAAAQRASE